VEQQEQLHIVDKGNEDQDEAESGHQFFHVSMLQAGELPNTRWVLNHDSIQEQGISQKHPLGEARRQDQLQFRSHASEQNG